MNDNEKTPILSPEEREHAEILSFMLRRVIRPAWWAMTCLVVGGWLPAAGFTWHATLSGPIACATLLIMAISLCVVRRRVLRRRWF